jgi:hypothetical protein
MGLKRRSCGLVAESLRGPRLLSATARQHGISTSLLFTGRRAYRRGALTSATADAGFVPGGSCSGYPACGASSAGPH